MALLIGLAIATDQVTWVHLLVAAVIQGAAFSFMMPARQSIIPQLVGPGQLTNAIALNATAMSAMTLASPGFAGVLYALTGPDNVYFIMSGLGVTAVAVTSMVPQTGGGPVKKKGSMLKDIGEGMSYIRRSPLIMSLLIMGLATTLLAMPFRQLMPVFVVDIYHLGPEYMGLLLSVMGGSSLVGALFVASLSRWRRGLLLIIGSFMTGVALLLIASVPLYIAAIFFMIPLGLGDAARRTLNQSLALEVADNQYRGRVMGVFMLNRGMMPLGVLPTALLMEFMGARIAIGILAMLLLTFTTLILVTQKHMREIS